MNKSQEKEELMEKVFGKNAKNRKITSADLDILSEATTSFSNDLNELLNKSSKENKQLDELIQTCDSIITNNENIIALNNKKLEQQSSNIISNNEQLENLRKQIIEDYGSNGDSINISLNQEELLKVFEEIKEELNQEVICQQKYVDDFVKALRRPYVMGQNKSGLNTAILISGNENTGRHCSVEMAVKQLADKKLIKNNHYSIIDLNKYSSKEDENNFIIDNYSAICNSEVIVFDHIENIEPYYLNDLEEILLEGKLSLKKRYVLNNGQLVETNSSLVRNSIDSLHYQGKYIFYITNCKTSKLINVLGSRFINGLSDIVSTDSFSKEGIRELLENKGEEFKKKCLSNLNMDCVYDEEFILNLAEEYDGSNAAYVNEVYEDLYQGLSEYKLSHSQNDSMRIILSFKDKEIFFNEEKLSDYLPKEMNNQIEDVKKELEDIVGLKEVKEYIYSLQDFYEAQKRKQAQGLKTSEISKHMIFTGNPGTGKTTIARLLAKYLKAIGVLSNGQLIEVTRSDLVGKYVGHTAPLTMQVIESAKGGILFIDEAYSLYRGENDSFGLECIDTLVKAMEDNRDDLIVILAGYSKEMKEFLTANSGLVSRFPNQIEFPDYTAEELYQIALINARNAGYIVDEECKEDLIAYFDKIQKDDSQRSGNGRLARNMIEKAIIKQSTRILKDNGQIDLIKKEDFTY